MNRRSLLAGAVAALVLLLASCQATTTVAVKVHEDGSGTVTVTTVLDRAAAAQLPDLDQSLLVGDLHKAGWQVVGPSHTADGAWQVSASKPFADATQLQSVIDQVTGPAGPFRDFTLTRSHHFAKTSFHLTGTVDLSKGLDSFGDAKLRAALGGTMTGRSDATLAQELGAPLPQAIKFELTARLPGRGTKTYSPVLDGPPVAVSVSSADRSPAAWLFAFAALLALVGFVATGLLIARYNRLKAAPAYLHRPGGPRRPWED